jgi:hypothetical protein
MEEDKSEQCVNPCKQCGKKAVYRKYNYVDGQYLDDGCFCTNCNEYVEDPD